MVITLYLIIIIKMMNINVYLIVTKEGYMNNLKNQVLMNQAE